MLKKTFILDNSVLFKGVGGEQDFTYLGDQKLVCLFNIEYRMEINFSPQWAIDVVKKRNNGLTSISCGQKRAQRFHPPKLDDANRAYIILKTAVEFEQDLTSNFLLRQQRNVLEVPVKL